MTIELVSLSFFFFIPKFSIYQKRWKRGLTVLVYGLLWGSVIWVFGGFVAYCIFVASSVAKNIELQDEKSTAQLAGYLITLFMVGVFVAVGLFIFGIRDNEILVHSIWLAIYLTIRALWDVYAVARDVLAGLQVSAPTS